MTVDAKDPFLQTFFTSDNVAVALESLSRSSVKSCTQVRITYQED